MKQLLAATLFASTVAAAGCTSGHRSVNLDELRNAEAPYYYVGRAFEGDEVSFISRYRDHQANIIYGTCHADDDEGCSPPLAIQHSFCLGVLTISIFGNRGKAQRAAEALRPFSQGARARAKRPGDRLRPRGFMLTRRSGDIPAPPAQPNVCSPAGDRRR